MTDARNSPACTVAWVPGRESGRALAAPIATRLLGAPFRRVSAALLAAAPLFAETTTDDEPARRLEVRELDGGLRFGATSIAGSEVPRGAVFDSVFVGVGGQYRWTQR